MFCIKCGSQLPDDAAFCAKCGTKQIAESTQRENQNPESIQQTNQPTKELECPNCGAPISPKFGEMIITCEYCGSSVALANNGWKGITKHTMLPIKIIEQDEIMNILHKMMDKGLLHRHLQESSKLEEISLSMIPYWIIPTTATTNIIAADMAATVGNIATTVALAGVMGGAMGGFGGRSRGGMGPGLLGGMMMGGMMGNMSPSNTRKAYTIGGTYNCPIVALNALSSYQPHNYEFGLDNRIDFDAKKIPKSVKILNGDISEEAARNQAKTITHQRQSDEAHAKYHMIQQIDTQVDTSGGELLHVPIWFARYDHKEKKIILVIDANSGITINSIGL